MKKFAVIVLFLSFCLYAAAAHNDKSWYKNNEKHIAKNLDENGVPIDPDCKFQTLWENVTMNKVASRANIPNKFEKMTVVKFHYAGAWVAWSDEKGYHEPLVANYIPWSNFPDEISEYYAKYCFPKKKIKNLKIKQSFTLRTPQYDRHGKLVKMRHGNIIKARGITGLLCPEISNNVYVPYSDFPPLVRKEVGFWENEAYIPSMPVLERKAVDFNKTMLFLSTSELTRLKTFSNGYWVRASYYVGKKLEKKDFFIKKFKGRLKPNHKSDLHTFKEIEYHKVCTKCDLSDHTSPKYFNYMFDRQCRNACQVKHDVYALKKSGTQKVGIKILPAYEFDVDYSANNPPDSELVKQGKL